MTKVKSEKWKYTWNKGRFADFFFVSFNLCTETVPSLLITSWHSSCLKSSSLNCKTSPWAGRWSTTCWDSLCTIRRQTALHPCTFTPARCGCFELLLWQEPTCSPEKLEYPDVRFLWWEVSMWFFFKAVWFLCHASSPQEHNSWLPV